MQRAGMVIPADMKILKDHAYKYEFHTSKHLRYT